MFRWPSRKTVVELDSSYGYCDMMAEDQNGLTRKLSIANQRLVSTFPQQLKHASMVTNTHKTIEELLEVVFSMQSVPKLCNKDQQGKS
jgi:hypothetical protein